MTAQYSDEIRASQIIRRMMDLCETASCSKCFMRFASDIEYATIEAVKLGHIKVVQILINHVRSPTKIFCAAIRSNNNDLVDFMLFLNPNLNPPAQSLDHSVYDLPTTPLAKALGVENKKLIQYLHSANAFTCLNQGGRLKPLIIAAARWGNTSFMRQLLSYCDSLSSPFRPPSLAIGIALRNGHENMVWLLLENGASVSHSAESRDEDCPRHVALECQNISLAQAIQNFDISSIRDGDFDEALKWDDTSIIADLTLAYPILQLGSETLRNFCRRCIQNDKTELFRTFLESTSLFGSHGLDLTGCIEDAVKMGHSGVVCTFQSA
ncbi:hypothetical protein F5X98DRAFT_381922 [Xylaria grammica]|nr:hypothetical protein F5X98DRAFT_381922 [Xylaria grammica]